MRLIGLLFLSLCQHWAMAQSVDHWETVIYNMDSWRYRPGTSEPSANWTQLGFNDQAWSVGSGGIGYGDGDDNTTIPASLSLYLRREFELKDTSTILYAVLHADYDDAFVAYLNGVEIARSNIGMIGQRPAYNATADDYHEAGLYQGELPETYSLFGQSLKSRIREGTNVLAIQVHNHNINSSDLSSNFFLSVALSDTRMDYRATPSWFVPPFLASQLPLMIIRTTSADEIYDEPKVDAHMGIIDNGQGAMNTIFDAYNHYDGQIGIEIRGASSQMFPKKNYGFETRTATGANNNVALLGMPEENDWILHGPYSDKTLLRNVLAYHMGNATGQYTPRTRLCELIINEDYRGVYVLTERIKQDKNRVDIAKLRPEDIDGDELTGGYILQIDRDNEQIAEDGWYSSYPDSKFYAYHDPGYDQLLPVQRNYIRNYIDDYEQMMDGPGYSYLYDDYVDVDSWIDYFLVTELGKHIDAYKLSFYMYKDKDSNGGKLHFGPIWDFNLAFGNFDFGCSPAPEGWAYHFRGTCGYWYPFWVRKLVDIPQVSHRTHCRWAELREGPFHTDSLLQFIDDQVALLGEAQTRNFERWPTLGEYIWPNDYVGQTYNDEVNFLKNWLVSRLNWMDANMIGDCDLLVSDQEVLEQRRYRLFPNPVQSHLYVRTPASFTHSSTLALYDLTGRLLMEYDLRKEEERIDFSTLSDSFYLYVIQNDRGEVIEKGKLVKQQ